MPENESTTKLSFVAGADLSSSQYKAVKLNSSGNVIAGTVGGRCVGVLQNAPESGYAAEVASAGKCIMIAGESITAGEVVEAGSGGAAYVKTADGYAIGQACEDAASGAKFTVQLDRSFEGLGVSRATADGTITAGLILQAGTADDDVKTAGINSIPVGVAAAAATNNNPAHFYTYGLCEVTSGAAFARGASLVPDANGKARAAGYMGARHAVGVALDTSTGADESITMFVALHEYAPQSCVAEMVAEEDLTSYQGMGVKMGASDNNVVKSASGAECLGVLLNAPDVGEQALVGTAGVVTGTSGAAITLGAEVEVNAASKFVDATGGAEYSALGIALNETTGADEDVLILIRPRKQSEQVTIFSNAFIFTDTNAAVLETGAAFVDQNFTNEAVVVALPGLQPGDVITAFRVLGGLGATGGSATVVDAKLRSLEKAAGSVTNVDIDSIAQVSVVADTALDAEKALGAAETVAADKQYNVWIDITTANNAANDAYITGVEVDIKRTV